MAASQSLNAADGLPSARRVRSRRVLLWTALAVLLALNYAWTLWDLAWAWLEMERLILGLVVLAGAAFLVWHRREQALGAGQNPSKWALLFMASSFALLIVGTRCQLVFPGGMSGVFMRGTSIVLFLCGTVLLTCGWSAMRPLWAPAILLLFMFPESYFTGFWLPRHLQHLVTTVGARFLTLLGNEVVREGPLIRTATFSAYVEEGCTGIRSMLTVVPAALFFGAYGLRRVGTKAAFVLLAVPLAFVANLFRVVTTLLLGNYVSEKLAAGFFHYFAGMGVFLLCLAALLVFLKLLAMMETKEGQEEKEASEAPGGIDGPPLFARCGTGAFVVVGTFLLAGLAYQALEIWQTRVNAARYPSALEGVIPRTVGRWNGIDLEVNAGWPGSRGVTDWLYREYRTPDGPPVALLMSYWKPAIERPSGIRGHTPLLWLPAPDMEPRWSKSVEVHVAAAPAKNSLLTTNLFWGPRGHVVATYWQGSGVEPGALKEGSRGYLGIAVYGLKRVVSGKQGPSPEVAFQLVTPTVGPPEHIVSIHREFAAELLGVIWDRVLRAGGWQKGGGNDGK